MPVKYLITKMKGAFYAGSEKIAEKGLKLRKYVSLDGVKKMVNALHLSASSIIFSHVSRSEQKKILSSGKKAAAKPKAKKKAKKRRK